ncbi:MAG TPA: hypothetical protein VFZ22_05835 [Pyrinomonadaceae bacterium]|nr:hypothetical protein [Pyrinomonadaceae bacterium]
MRVMFAVLITALLLAGCSGKNDNEHTTATTIVPPPQQQVLRAELRAGPQETPDTAEDPSKPLLLLNIPQTTIRDSEELVVNFVLGNAALKGDGGEYRIRYMVDDGDMQWIDRWQQLALAGWLPGNHILRVELIAPDGWPRATAIREITVEK